MTQSASDKRAADRARAIIDSATRLTDALLGDLSERSGGLHLDRRVELRSEWIVLVARHLVESSVHDARGGDDRFSRPVVCAWCGNRHRSVVPFETTTQGDACASSVFQVTEEATKMLQYLMRGASGASPPPIAIGEWLVKGHYGSSSYDCDLYRFVKNSPTAGASPVCDNCVGERLAVGDLERIEGNYP